MNPADSCILYGYVYGQDLQPARNAALCVVKTKLSNGLIAYPKRCDTSNTNGYIRFKVWRNSTVTLQGPDVLGFEKPVDVIIGNVATMSLESYTRATALATQYIIAVPVLQIKDSFGNTYAFDSLELSQYFTINSTTFPKRITLDLVSLSAALSHAYGDSIFIADSIARYLLLKIDTLETEIANSGSWNRYTDGNYDVIVPKNVDDSLAFRIDANGWVSANGGMFDYIVLPQIGFAEVPDTAYSVVTMSGADGSYRVNIKDFVTPWHTQMQLTNEQIDFARKNSFFVMMLGDGWDGNFLYSTATRLDIVGSDAAAPNGGVGLFGSELGARKVILSANNIAGDADDVTLTKDGKLGIGVLNPANKTEIAGNLKIDSTVTAKYIAIDSLKLGSTFALKKIGSEFSFRKDAYEFLSFDPAAFNSITYMNLKAPSYTQMYFYRTNPADSGNYTAIYSDNPYDISSGSTSLYVGDTEKRNGYLNNRAFFKVNNGSYDLTFSEKGNFGINYDLPAYSLSVNGSVYINQDSILFAPGATLKRDSITIYKPVTMLSELYVAGNIVAANMNATIFDAGTFLLSSSYVGTSTSVGMQYVTSNKLSFNSLSGQYWKHGVGGSVTDMHLTPWGAFGIGIIDPANRLELAGNLISDSTIKAKVAVKTPLVYTEAIDDTSGVLNPNGQTLAAQVTADAGDSITVTVTGVLPTDVIAVSYIGGTTAPTIHPWSNVFAANTLTIYGDNGRKLSYIRIRK